jgi:hypothetical protein
MLTICTAVGYVADLQRDPGAARTVRGPAETTGGFDMTSLEPRSNGASDAPEVQSTSPAAPCGHAACSESPAAVLDAHPVLTARLVAYVLDIRVTRGARRGELSRRQALELMQSGALRLLDPDQPAHRLTVATTEMRRYIAEGPRTVTS